MAMPRRLFMFDLFINGESFLGKVTELTVPKLSLKTEDYQGAGMPGSVAVTMGFEAGALDMEVTVGGLESTLIKQFGGMLDGTQCRYSGSYLDDQTGRAVACEIQTRGRFVEVDWGASKQGEGTTHKYPVKNTYYKLTVDNEVLVEIDLLGLVWNVGGKDLMEQHRKNIGH